MHDRQDLGAVAQQGLLQLLEAEGLPPGLLDRHHLGPVAAGHIGQAQTEIALHRHQHLLTGLDRVGQGGLHGGAAGATHGNSETVVGLPGVAQQLLHLPHQLDIEGIQVADRGAGQGLQHGRMGVGWSRTEQQPVWCGDRGQSKAMGGIDWRQHREESRGLG